MQIINASVFWVSLLNYMSFYVHRDHLMGSLHSPWPLPLLSCSFCQVVNVSAVFGVSTGLRSVSFAREDKSLLRVSTCKCVKFLHSIFFLFWVQLVIFFEVLSTYYVWQWFSLIASAWCSTRHGTAEVRIFRIIEEKWLKDLLAYTISESLHCLFLSSLPGIGTNFVR